MIIFTIVFRYIWFNFEIIHLRLSTRMILFDNIFHFNTSHRQIFSFHNISVRKFATDGLTYRIGILSFHTHTYTQTDRHTYTHTQTGVFVGTNLNISTKSPNRSANPYFVFCLFRTLLKYSLLDLFKFHIFAQLKNKEKVCSRVERNDLRI